MIGGCIVLHSESGTTYLPLWPPDFRLAGNQALSILDGSGEVIPFGKLIAFGGGEFDARRRADVVSRLLNGDVPPAECSLDLVWVVTTLAPD